MCPPLIYGKGTGPFNQRSMQVPWMIRGSIKTGKAIHIGKGANIWSHVHVQDLARAYLVLLDALLGGDPRAGVNADGYYFVESGEHNFKDLAQAIAGALKKNGGIGDGEMQGLDENGAKELFGDLWQLAWGALGGNSRARGDRIRDLGWKPTAPALFDEVEGDVVAILQEKKP
ncbi:hypothetical protein HK104_005289 [Borealophlyctis nickersoniae]|nr:hypothetical protein HK104_005289 [Borealophlyctis nickersoniae]